MRRPLLALLVVVILAPAASSQMPLEGSFTAARDCPAYQSIKKQTNPDGASVHTGQSYRLIAKNKETASHYLVEIEGADPAQRWVAVACGSIDGAAAAPPPAAGDDDGAQSVQGKPRFVLALGWQAAFCETRPSKAECASQTTNRFDASHFTLHGLWPQPRRRAYCGVDEGMVAADEAGQWTRLPEPKMTVETRAALDQAMPGTRSLLHRHEWIKHGTCYPKRDAETYFADALLVADAVNASPVQQLFAANDGRQLTTADIRGAFDRAFGAGAGARVRVACVDDGDRRLISEITVGLTGQISPDTTLSRLILAAGPTDPGCPGGIVDPVGLQ